MGSGLVSPAPIRETVSSRLVVNVATTILGHTGSAKHLLRGVGCKVWGGLKNTLSNSNPNGLGIQRSGFYARNVACWAEIRNLRYRVHAGRLPPSFSYRSRCHRSQSGGTGSVYVGRTRLVQNSEECNEAHVEHHKLGLFGRERSGRIVASGSLVHQT